MLSRSGTIGSGAQHADRTAGAGRRWTVLLGLVLALAAILAVSAGATERLTRKEGTGATDRRSEAGPQAALSADAAPRRHPHFGRTAQIRDHVPGAEEVCLPAGASDTGSPEKVQLSRLFETLERSPLARDLLAEAALRDVYICLDDDTELLAYYYAGLRLIGIKSTLDEGQRIGYLAHELAHVRQHPIYSDNRYFPAGDLMLLRRVREAAAEAVATCIAWQLREAGYAAAWHAKRSGAYGDLAAAFEAAFGETGPDSEAAGRERAATRAAFDSWFVARWRLDVYDRMTLEHLARISDDDMGLVPPRLRLSHRFLLGIGQYGRDNFLAITHTRLLTDDYYRGSVSPDHVESLQALLRPRDVDSEADASWWIGIGS